MFITKKKHKQIVEDLISTNKDLSNKLDEARNLKAILEKLTPEGGYVLVNNFWNTAIASGLPDSIAHYVDDILGGHVIKQEGTKCLVVDKQGAVRSGLTKQKPDEGYNYKLIRE